MARSHGVVKVEVWEPANDFRKLTIDGQWTYLMLVSQPQINNLGVLPYTPERWHRLASDLGPGRLDVAILELERERYIVIDTDTGELLVRTFIHHDAVWKQPKLVTNARRLHRELESDRLRVYLAGRHPWLAEPWPAARIAAHEGASNHHPETPSDTPIETPSDTPIADPVENPPEKPLSKGVTEGVSLTRARDARATHPHAQDALPQPQPQPQPQPDTQTRTAAAEHPREPQPETDAAAAASLTELGLDPALASHHDPTLVLAWTQLAKTEATSNPAGFAIAGIETGEFPSPRRANIAEPELDRDINTILDRGAKLYARTHDPDDVADWLAGIPWLNPTQRTHALEIITAAYA